ncbi:MAG: hypothetical protein AMXMBFR77_27790 [Phycisphaerales bacterium]
MERWSWAVQFDLFGAPEPPRQIRSGPGRPRLHPRPDATPRQDAVAGERACGTCAHLTAERGRRSKCALTRSGSRVTDIARTDAACALYEGAP